MARDAIESASDRPIRSSESGVCLNATRYLDRQLRIVSILRKLLSALAPVLQDPADRSLADVRDTSNLSVAHSHGHRYHELFLLSRYVASVVRHS